ncbi:MAG: hypothetical protein HWN66_01150 [Candidatus Helarchaeota archaeon]|nr:hypothetical protein [Candidatus Helarchaeota archaeon]
MAPSGEFVTNIISIITIFVAMVMAFIIGIKVYFQKYRQEKSTPLFLLSLFALFVGIALIFLGLEKYYLSVAKDQFLGIIFGGMALVSSVIALITVDSFAFSIEFLEKFKILTVITSFFGAIISGFWILDPTRTVENEEIIFGDWWSLGFPITSLVIFLISGILAFIPSIIILVYAKRNWKEDPLFSKQLLLLGIGAWAFLIAYVMEIVGLEPLLASIMRFFFVVAAIFWYWALFKLK